MVAGASHATLMRGMRARRGASRAATAAAKTGVAFQSTTTIKSAPAIAARAASKPRPPAITSIEALLPWRVVDLDTYPFPGMWSFNASIHADGHADGDVLRCAIRCADYAMPGGKLVRGPNARPPRTISRCAMLLLDPEDLRVAKVLPMQERDGLSRVPTCTHTGFEDLRVFRAGGKLLGIAASLHLRRPDKRVSRQHREQHVVEQVLVELDEATYDIVSAHPLRGPWDGKPQKNWSPFDGADAPRFLYSIDRGQVVGLDPAGEPAREPQALPVARIDQQRGSVVRYRGLRGGSQLVRAPELGEDAWLGVGHDMNYSGGSKHYWHVWYACDGAGRPLYRSPPVKLAPEGIEFAAGLVLDRVRDRALVSFGVDDMRCRVGETRLSALFELLRPGEISKESP